MCSSLKVSIAICICAAVFITYLNSQAIEYSCRIQNISFVSETASSFVANLTIFRNFTHHRVFITFNITKEIYVKNLNIVIYRCVYEKSACENFQEWNFTGNVARTFFYMQNQMWSPLFTNFKPRMTFPLVRKGIYENDDFKLDTKATITFYPEAANYYFRAITTMFDYNNKKAAIVHLELTIDVLDERGIKRNFRNSTRRPVTKGKDEN